MSWSIFPIFVLWKELSACDALLWSLELPCVGEENDPTSVPHISQGCSLPLRAGYFSWLCPFSAVCRCPFLEEIIVEESSGPFTCRWQEMFDIPEALAT